MRILNALSGSATANAVLFPLFCAETGALAKADRMMSYLSSPVMKRRLAFATGLLCAAAATMLLADPSWAVGTTGFDRLQSTLSQWITGSLGKSLALAFLVIGLAGGLLRGSLSAAVIALGCALALVVGPEIIDSVFTTGG